MQILREHPEQRTILGTVPQAWLEQDWKRCKHSSSSMGP